MFYLRQLFFFTFLACNPCTAAKNEPISLSCHQLTSLFSHVVGPVKTGFEKIWAPLVPEVFDCSDSATKLTLMAVNKFLGIDKSCEKTVSDTKNTMIAVAEGLEEAREVISPKICDSASEREFARIGSEGLERIRMKKMQEALSIQGFKSASANGLKIEWRNNDARTALLHLDGRYTYTVKRFNPFPWVITEQYPTNPRPLLIGNFTLDSVVVYDVRIPLVEEVTKVVVMNHQLRWEQYMELSRSIEISPAQQIGISFFN